MHKTTRYIWVHRRLCASIHRWIKMKWKERAMSTTRRDIFLEWNWNCDGSDICIRKRKSAFMGEKCSRSLRPDDGTWPDSVWLGTENGTAQVRRARAYSAPTKIYRRHKRATWNYVNFFPSVWWWGRRILRSWPAQAVVTARWSRSAKFCRRKEKKQSIRTNELSVITKWLTKDSAKKCSVNAQHRNCSRDEFKRPACVCYSMVMVCGGEAATVFSIDYFGHYFMH